MLGRIIRVLGRTNLAVTQPAFHVPKRNWNQCGHLIVTPPRNKVSGGEMLVHIFFMIGVWLSPIAYFLTQLKVWRRLYVEG